MSGRKTVLVTGGAGFIGSHLCARLVQEGWHVISLDNYFTGSRNTHVEGVAYRTGHTKNIEQLIPESPELVFHLGEYSRVEKSFEDIETVWDLNQFGTFAVLEFCRLRKSKLVYAGSSTKFADDGIGRSQSPYAWSKASMTELVMNYGTWFGLSYAITYFYNVYGPGERTDAYGTVVAIFKEQYKQGYPLGVVSPGTQERIFTHVDDVVSALVLVGATGSGDGYGIGGEDTISILELARLFGREILMLPPRQGNRMKASLDSSKTRSLGWKPLKNLKEELSMFIRETASELPPEKRIIVFAPTFYPVEGPAERALVALMRDMPDLQFDIITTYSMPEAKNVKSPVKNAVIHRVGFGNRFDKYLLPIFGVRKAAALATSHRYIFSWSLMASYAALTALLARKQLRSPILITLADQKLSWRVRMFLRFLLRKTDQVYANNPLQGTQLESLQDRTHAEKSFGSGNAFANQIRFAYTKFLDADTTHQT